MSDILLSIAPIFLLIVLGYWLRQGGIPNGEFWNLADRLVYWVLFPALLFSNTSTIDLSGGLLSSFAIVIYTGFGCAVLFALISSRLSGLNARTATSVLQGSARHNSFIALAVAERLLGAEGLAQATLVTALLIPVTNITVVTLMASMIRGGGRRLSVMRAVGRDLARNPLLIAVLAGLLANVLELAPLPIVNDMAEILGAAALPIMLLCVGANIRWQAMTGAGLPVVLSMAGKMVVFPAMILVAAQVAGVTDVSLLVLIIFGAVPTAASSYTLARQMGGDAPTMATIITLQTALSFVTLPLTVTLVQWWLLHGVPFG